MAIGSIINLGGGGGSSSDSKVRFIFNTANLTQGDIIRVRSVLDTSYVVDNVVTTVGDYITCDVPSKDKYRISLVKEVEVDGVTTEVETSVTTKVAGYGDCFEIDTFVKTSLAGAQGILNAHQQQSIYSIGDIIPITYAGSSFNMQVLAIDLYEANTLILGAEEIPLNTVYNNSTGNYAVYSSSVLRQQAQAFYTQISEDDKQYIKKMNRCCVTQTGWTLYEDYVWVPNRGEVTGSNRMGTPPLAQTQFPMFMTATGRIRQYIQGHNPTSWWLPDFQEGYANCMCFINASGGAESSSTGGGQNNARGLMPCFMMKADS